MLLAYVFIIKSGLCEISSQFTELDMKVFKLCTPFSLYLSIFSQCLLNHQTGLHQSQGLSISWFLMVPSGSRPPNIQGYNPGRHQSAAVQLILANSNANLPWTRLLSKADSNSDTVIVAAGYWGVTAGDVTGSCVSTCVFKGLFKFWPYLTSTKLYFAGVKFHWDQKSLFQKFGKHHSLIGIPVKVGVHTL